MSADSGGSGVQGIEQARCVSLMHSLLHLVGWEPCDLPDLVGRVGLAVDDVAAEHQGDDAAAHVLVDASEGLGLDPHAGLLQDLADQAGLDGLVEFEDAAGWLPVAVVAPPHGQELALLVDDRGSHADRVPRDWSTSSRAGARSCASATGAAQGL